MKYNIKYKKHGTYIHEHIPVVITRDGRVLIEENGLRKSPGDDITNISFKDITDKVDIEIIN